ncbi:MAG: DNA polymerase I [Erysipelotrichaceae bacterium]|nr:DNA polymerase I [Erysipelotrichaceae bacterium]
MEKIILVDGNNLLFRSYYATAYNGNFMHNSKNFPTNALFGFVNMMNKIINEEKPTYIMVAFDKGKTFRHKKYENYKAGRIETPNELKAQIPYSRELLKSMGIKYYEVDDYEADDIIGTFAAFCDQNPNCQATIISSDHDLLQLITPSVHMKMLKSKDFVRYTKTSFMDEYGIEPIKIIDLKALSGDASDNIPGVKGIGEKTAIKLLQDYRTLDGIYANLDSLSPKMREKLVNDKTNAYMSYELATICTHVPINISLDEVRYTGPTKELNKLYEELEFYSFIKKENKISEVKSDVKITNDLTDLNITEPAAVYLEILGENYHHAPILGLAIYNKSNNYFVPFETLKKEYKKLNFEKYTYDLKKLYVALKWQGIELSNITFDTMIAAYLLDYTIKDDIAVIANSNGYEIPFYEIMYGKNNKYKEQPIEEIAATASLKAKFIYETYNRFNEELVKEEMQSLYYDIEHPLATVLGDMEYNGVYVERKTLDELGEEFKIKLELISSEIYNLAGEVFNISSPKQLGEILFEKLNLPHGKKNSNGYSTSMEVLTKLSGKYQIVNKIIEYRAISKLYSTYIEGLKDTIMADGKIHTIYTQTLTRTGRLSSIEPNLQNIPVRSELGKLIRKAFVPSKDSLILSGDYSQIELRILSHMADSEALITAFKENKDIHTKTASDVFKVPEELVTKDMRRMAKAVNFGIIYGISSFGLAENLNIPVKEAKEFIDNYFITYPGIKVFMEKEIAEAYKNGYVKTLFNRKRNIPELANKNYIIRNSGERIALNTPIQGTSADILKIAMIRIAKALKEKNLKSKMILQVHDELVFDCKKEELEDVVKIMTATMENVCELKVPLKVEIEYGDNWYQLK